MANAKTNHTIIHVVLMSDPTGWVTLSYIVGDSFLTASVSSITVSPVFSLVSRRLSCSRLSVWPYWLIISFKLMNISYIFPILFATFVTYSVLWFMFASKSENFWLSSYSSISRRLAFCESCYASRSSTQSSSSYISCSSFSELSSSFSLLLPFSESLLLSFSRFSNSYFLSSLVLLSKSALLIFNFLKYFPYYFNIC